MSLCLGMVWYGMVWYGVVLYGMVWYGKIWYGMAWYGICTSLNLLSLLVRVAGGWLEELEIKTPKLSFSFCFSLGFVNNNNVMETIFIAKNSLVSHHLKSTQHLTSAI